MDDDVQPNDSDGPMNAPAPGEGRSDTVAEPPSRGPDGRGKRWRLGLVLLVLLVLLAIVLLLLCGPRKQYLYHRTPKYRRRLLLEFGAHKDTQQAINAGLKWLADHQLEDGSWAGSKIRCPEGDRCTNVNYNSEYTGAVTGAALLAFLGRGISEVPEKVDDPDQRRIETRFSKAVKKAIDYLLSTQSQEDGSWGEGYMYAQGICTLALVEAEALTKRRDLQPRIRKSLAFITKSQSGEGGWDYYGQGKRKGNLERSDTSIMAWVFLSLMSARSAGYAVPDQTFLNVLSNCHRITDPKTQWVGYTHRGGNNTRTCLAVGLFSRLYLGYHPSTSPVRTQARLLLENHVPPDYYVWYHAGVAMFQMQDFFPEWNTRVQYSLIGLQSRNRHMTGSWDALGEYEGKGGRVLTTALCVMSLEVYFRHLLLYGAGVEQFPAPHAIVDHFAEEKDKTRRLIYLDELGYMVADRKVRDFLKAVAGKDPDEQIRAQAKASLDRLRARRDE